MNVCINLKVVFVFSKFDERKEILQVSEEALKKRFDQGWLQEVQKDLDNLISRIRVARKNKQVIN